jgi:hypothetical protein
MVFLGLVSELAEARPPAGSSSESCDMGKEQRPVRSATYSGQAGSDERHCH